MSTKKENSFVNMVLFVSMRTSLVHNTHLRNGHMVHSLNDSAEKVETGRILGWLPTGHLIN